MSNEDGVTVMGGNPLGASSPGAGGDGDRILNEEDNLTHLRLSQPLPRPKVFSGNSSKTFKSFVKQYESWADSMWGPNINDKWIRGLESLLEGHPLILYNSYLNQNISYDEIKTRLMSIFMGESDPFTCKKLLRLKSIKKGGTESWTVFMTRIENLISEINPESSARERSNRLREVLLQKMDNSTTKSVVNQCMLKSDFTPNAVFEAVKILDTIPFEMYGDQEEVGEVLNLGITNKEKDTEMHCLYCGSKRHYMADCISYSNTCSNLSQIKLESNKGRDSHNKQSQGNPWGGSDQEYHRQSRREEYNRRSDSPWDNRYQSQNRGYSPYRGREQGRGFSPYVREQSRDNGRGYSPYRSNYNAQNKGRDHYENSQYRGYSPYRNDQNINSGANYERSGRGASGSDFNRDDRRQEGRGQWNWGRGPRGQVTADKYKSGSNNNSLN